MVTLTTLWLLLQTQAQEGSSQTPDLKSVEISHTEVVITYTDRFARNVSMRFSFDGFQKAWKPGRVDQERGVFTFTFPISGQRSPFHRESGNIEYVFMVDGLLKHDPTNPQTRLTAYGTQVSILELSQPIYDLYESPQRRPDGKTAFIYHGEPTTTPVVSLDWNGWHPRQLEMNEIQPGIWAVEIDLPAGDYQYNYIVDGERILDPLNGLATRDRRGTMMSLITVSR